MKKVFVFLISVMLMLIQTGCFDSREIDETAYIIAIGIDSSNDGDYKYTFQFAAPLAISGEGGGESGGGEKKSESGDEESAIQDANNPGVRNTVIKAADFYTARNMLNNFLSKNIDMSHLKMIVFSSKLEDDGFVRHSQLLSREREVRPHTVLALAEGSAEEFLRCVNPELEANTAKYYELMSLRSNNIYAPSIRLHEFTDRLATSGSSVLPLACVSELEESKDFENISSDSKRDIWIQSGSDRISSSKSELRGMAIFRQGKLCGTMSGDDALIYNILNRDIESFTVTLRNPHANGKTMSFDVRLPSAASYHAKLTDKGAIITVIQHIEPRFLGEGLPEGYESHARLMSDFKSAVQKRILAFLNTTSRQFGADIMGCGDCVRQKTATLKEWDSINWDEKYKNARFDVVIE